jgi:hypothetical protein
MSFFGSLALFAALVGSSAYVLYTGIALITSADLVPQSSADLSVLIGIATVIAVGSMIVAAADEIRARRSLERDPDVIVQALEVPSPRGH